MIKYLLKDILGGNYKIDINEIGRKNANNVILLSELIDLEFGENENGTYIKSPGGVLFCRNRLRLERASNLELKAEWDFPYIMKDIEYSISAIRENKDNAVYRGSAFDYNNKQIGSLTMRLTLSNGIDVSPGFNTWAEVYILGRYK